VSSGHQDIRRIVTQVVAFFKQPLLPLQHLGLGGLVSGLHRLKALVDLRRHVRLVRQIDFVGRSRTGCHYRRPRHPCNDKEMNWMGSIPASQHDKLPLVLVKH